MTPLSSVPPATINGQPILSHMDHIVLTVADIDASVEFYVKVLGMRKEVFGPKGKERVALVFGSQKINLQHERAKVEPHAGEATKGSADICFITPHPMSSIMSHLQALDVPHRQSVWQSSSAPSRGKCQRSHLPTLCARYYRATPLHGLMGAAEQRNVLTPIRQS